MNIVIIIVMLYDVVEEIEMTALSEKSENDEDGEVLM